MSDIKISVIAAMTKGERAIGIRNTLPWRLPADMALFKKHTLNKPVLMGRRTAASIRGPLPNRLNLVLTSGEAPFGGQVAVRSVEEAIEYLEKRDEQWLTTTNELMVIGGAMLYETVLPIAHRLYLTQVDASYPEADTFFPEYDPYDWDIVHRETHPPEGNYHGFSFGIYERR